MQTIEERPQPYSKIANTIFFIGFAVGVFAVVTADLMFLVYMAIIQSAASFFRGIGSWQVGQRKFAVMEIGAFVTMMIVLLVYILTKQ